MNIPFINEKEVFEVNPNLEACVHVIGPEEVRVVVVDACVRVFAANSKN